MKKMIERAGSLRGTSVTDFVIASAQHAAALAIQDYERIRLRDEDREVFVEALIKPPLPNCVARAAAARYMSTRRNK
jgi:uncharacterized protein (DUF1778 family)